MLEKGDYWGAYNAAKKLDKSSVTNSFLDEIQKELYAHAQREYRNDHDAAAKKYFEALDGYQRSEDYLALIRSSEESFSNYLNDYYYEDLFELLEDNFEDADKIMQENDYLLEIFLTGSWEDGSYNDPYYFYLYDHGDSMTSEYNLPFKEVDGYFFIVDGIFRVGESESSSTKVYRFTIIDADTISVYCYKDGSTHKLYRQ